MLKIRVLLAALSVIWTFALSAGTPQTVAQSVLDRLYAANGNLQFKQPKLVLTNENKKVAAFSPWRNTITLDEKAYDICRSFGRDSLAALAYMLGHEMVHAFQSQIRGQRLQTNFLAYDHGYNADVRIEKVADIQGLFNAYLAGYGVLRVMPELIDAVYSAYDLTGKNLQGYPSLEERKACSREVIAIAENLRDVFESCNYLLAIGQNSLACSGYEYILQYYQGVEIYNNLGVAYTLNAQQFWNPQTDKYIYPLEADWDTKLSRLAAARGQEQIDPSMEPLRIALLDKALGYFQRAARLDPGYLPAHINVVCAMNMKGQPAEAIKYAEAHLLKLKQQKKNRLRSLDLERIDLAVGISYALTQNMLSQGRAEKIFQELANSGNVLSGLYGRQNLHALRGEQDNSILTEIPLPKSFRQVVGQMELGRTGDLERTPLDENAGIYFAQKTSIGSKTMVFSNDQGNLVSLMRFSNRLVSDVVILPPQEDLKTTAYRNVVATRDGFFLKSPRDRVVLKIDAKGNVLEMVKYVEHG